MMMMMMMILFADKNNYIVNITVIVVNWLRNLSHLAFWDDNDDLYGEIGILLLLSEVQETDCHLRNLLAYLILPATFTIP